MIGKLKAMLGFSNRTPDRSVDPVSVQVSIAVQKNEQAGQRTREALKDLKMSDTLRQLAGKIK